MFARLQFAIPARIRKFLRMKPTERWHEIEYRGRIELVPVRPTKSARGSLTGVDTDVPRDADRI